MATPHIESKKEDIAKIVLMPGDPKRAEYIAKNYLTDIKLVNQVRGMTAYTGYYGNKRITIFPSVSFNCHLSSFNKVTNSSLALYAKSEKLLIVSLGYTSN